MKYFSILLLAFSILTGNAQTDQRKFYLGLQASPEYCYRVLSNSEGSPTADFLIKSRNEKEVYKTGFNAGLNFGYHLNSHFTLETGLHYSNCGFQTKKDALFFVGILPDSSPNRIQVKFKYHTNYIDIPFKILYHFNEDNNRYFASFACIANIFQSNKNTTIVYYPSHTDRDHSKGYDPNRQFNLTLGLGAGMEKAISEKIFFRVEPHIRFELMDIFDAPIITHLYSVGVQVGIYHKL